MHELIMYIYPCSCKYVSLYIPLIFSSLVNLILLNEKNCVISWRFLLRPLAQTELFLFFCLQPLPSSLPPSFLSFLLNPQLRIEYFRERGRGGERETERETYIHTYRQTHTQVQRYRRKETSIGCLLYDRESNLQTFWYIGHLSQQARASLFLIANLFLFINDLLLKPI